MTIYHISATATRLSVTMTVPIYGVGEMTVMGRVICCSNMILVYHFFSIKFFKKNILIRYVLYSFIEDFT